MVRFKLSEKRSNQSTANSGYFLWCLSLVNLTPLAQSAPDLTLVAVVDGIDLPFDPRVLLPRNGNAFLTIGMVLDLVSNLFAYYGA